MRITDSYRADITVSNLDAETQRLFTAQQVAASGKNLQTSSDNPSLYAQSLSLEDATWQHSRFDGTVAQVKSSLQTYDSALLSLTQVVQSARQVVVQASSNIGSTSDRAGLLSEAQSLYSRALSIANQQQGSTFLFGGSKAASPPYTDAADGVAYSGDSREQSATVDVGESLSYTLSGTEVFGQQPNNPDQVLGALQHLITNLQSGTSDTLTGSLDQFDTVLSKLGSLQAETGAKTQQITTLVLYKQQVTQALQAQTDGVNNADIAAAAVHLSQQQNAYSAALSVASRLDKDSLISRLQA